jgi:hypothetical protein
MDARREQNFDSVDAAVAAAKKLQSDRGYDLFRGQPRPWPVVSSFRRLVPHGQPEARSRLNQFINWAKLEPALVPYGFDSDQAIAVAQHYGIPTTFIDFTTNVEVARHFATEPRDGGGEESDPDPQSCIIAVRSDELMAWVEKRFMEVDEFLGPQIIRLTVPNLWRLEAQCGVFLVDDDLLDDYPFDYLSFPRSASDAASWNRARVYPKDKSDLELIVEQWLWHERASAGSRELRRQLEAATGRPLQVFESEPTTGIGLKGIIRPEPHPSWTGRESAWLRPKMTFEEARPRAIDRFEISLQSGMDLDTIRAAVLNDLQPSLIGQRRSRSAEWYFVLEGAVLDEPSAKLKRQWDALRIDGYSDAQVVESFVRSITLAMLQLGHVGHWAAFDGPLRPGRRPDALVSLFGADLLVEYCGLVGYGRARVSAAELKAAVRDDVDRYLPEDFFKDTGPTDAERMGHLLVGIHKPDLLFDFDRFTDFYARQVIPVSTILRPDLPLYPIFHLTTFGVP